MRLIELLKSVAPTLYAALIAMLEKAKVDPALSPKVEELEAMLNAPLGPAHIAAFLTASGPELLNIVQLKFEPKKHASGII